MYPYIDVQLCYQIHIYEVFKFKKFFVRLADAAQLETTNDYNDVSTTMTWESIHDFEITPCGKCYKNPVVVIAMLGF